jgi:hypothetical protein
VAHKEKEFVKRAKTVGTAEQETNLVSRAHICFSFLKTFSEEIYKSLDFWTLFYDFWSQSYDF